MTLRDLISNLMSHFKPLSLTKQIMSDTHSVLQLHVPAKTQPWVDTHLVELTQEDFAA